MGNRYFTLSNEKDEGHTIPYVIELTLCDDVVSTIREDGWQCPDDAFAASFTVEEGDEPDVSGFIYLPYDAEIRTIIHEATHAVIGICHRQSMQVPSRDSSVEDEELFVETIALLSSHLIEVVRSEVFNGVG